MQDEAKGCEKKFIYSLIVVIMDFIKYACSELYGANLILLNLNCTTSKIRGGEALANIGVNCTLTGLVLNKHYVKD
jgi:hypothetical protein